MPAIEAKIFAIRGTIGDTATYTVPAGKHAVVNSVATLGNGSVVINGVQILLTSPDGISQATCFAPGMVLPSGTTLVGRVGPNQGAILVTGFEYDNVT